MTNLWSFLQQTAAVTLTAWFLWGIRLLVSRQLPPRWQYGFWSILALRILLPAVSGRYVFLPAGLWIETLKILVERQLDSALTKVYTADRLGHILPYIQAVPISITDWLFVLYIAGILVSLTLTAAAYLRLRRSIDRLAQPVGEALQARLEAVGHLYDLPVCPMVQSEGILSPFICGIRKPVLVVPAGVEIDDKVLLHELLHLRYHDAAQNVFWRILRALHWCNPLMYPIFSQITNDMEMTCDSRVLERLEGEERREYGRILLSMANDRYASVPGTSSIANGGRNIRQRIGAIVYFKKFPKGMAVLGLSMLLLLSMPSLYGAAYTVDAQALEPKSAFAMEQAIALTRLRRCTTPAGAIDTYAKGLMLHNGLYRMMAAPAEEMDALLEQTAHVTNQPNRYPYWLESGGPFGEYPNIQGYRVCNLAEQPDGSYRAILLFDRRGIKPDAAYQYESILLPVCIREENGWVVEVTGSALVEAQDARFMEENLWQWGIEPLAVYRGMGETGLAEANIYTVHTMEREPQDFWELMNGTSIDLELHPDGEFTNAERYFLTTYTTDAQREVDFKRTVGLQVAERMEADDEAYDFTASLSSEAFGFSTDGICWKNNRILNDWDGTTDIIGSRRWKSDDGEDFVLPHRYEACIYWDGHPVDAIILTEVQ